jgi:alkylated DNA repair dioxygenase AlkB
VIATSGIPGLRYVADYLDRPTHDRLFTAVDAEPWQTTIDHRVQIHGYNYSRRERAAFRIGPLPEWGVELAERLRDDGLLPEVANQIVANDYQPGAGIFAHVDQAVFGDAVASVSLGSACVMQFSSLQTGTAVEILLEPRSVLVLSGQSRWGWTHGIPARRADPWQNRVLVRARRVSLTFRVVAESAFYQPSGVHQRL